MFEWWIRGVALGKGAVDGGEVALAVPVGQGDEPTLGDSFALGTQVMRAA